MDISFVSSIGETSALSQMEQLSRYRQEEVTLFNGDDNTETFEALFQSAMSMVNETNALTNKAEEEEIKYAVGDSDSMVDLMAAQQKANMSLQYTISMRNAVISAYKEIMNLSF